jgi:hypothetical protein
MLILIACVLYTVTAQTSTFSRTYLRGLKRLEDKRITVEFIHKGFTYIENAIFTAAKQGLLKYRTEPFEGCEVYANHEASPIRMDKDVCENIVNEIQKLVSERFPDSEILYNPNTKRYTLKWD